MLLERDCKAAYPTQQTPSSITGAAGTACSEEQHQLLLPGQISIKKTMVSSNLDSLILMQIKTSLILLYKEGENLRWPSSTHWSFSSQAPDQPSHGNNRAKGQEQPRKSYLVLWKNQGNSLQQIKIPFWLSRCRTHLTHIINHKVTYALDGWTINLVRGTSEQLLPGKSSLNCHTNPFNSFQRTGSECTWEINSSLN